MDDIQEEEETVNIEYDRKYGNYCDRDINDFKENIQSLFSSNEFINPSFSPNDYIPPNRRNQIGGTFTDHNSYIFLTLK